MCSKQIASSQRRRLNSMFKTEISEGAQGKINYLCKHIPEGREWSGILFYKVEGDFSNLCFDSCTVHVVDILPLNIGSSVFTKYDADDPQFLEYITNHPEVTEEGVYRGHIHSHHNMATFFSSTDCQELFESAEYFNIFVSLIVNNAGSYSIGYSFVATEKGVNSYVEVVDWNGNKKITELNKESEEVIYYNWSALESSVKVDNEFCEIVNTLIAESTVAQNTQAFSQKPKETNHLIPVNQATSSKAPTIINTLDKGNKIDSGASWSESYALESLLAKLICCGQGYNTIERAAAAIPYGISLDSYMNNVERIFNSVWEEINKRLTGWEEAEILDYWCDLLDVYEGINKEYLEELRVLLTGVDVEEEYNEDENVDYSI